MICIYTTERYQPAAGWEKGADGCLLEIASLRGLLLVCPRARAAQQWALSLFTCSFNNASSIYASTYLPLYNAPARARAYARIRARAHDARTAPAHARAAAAMTKTVRFRQFKPSRVPQTGPRVVRVKQRETGLGHISQDGSQLQARAPPYK